MSTPTRRPHEPSRDKDVAAAPPAGGQNEQPGARKRAGYLLRHAKLWIGALILLAIAAIVAAVSLGAFTTSQASVGNTAATGSLSLSGGDAVIFNETGMVPGDARTGRVTIENTGESTGAFSLDAGDPTGDAALAGQLKLKIDEMDSAAADATVKTTAYPEGAFASQPDQLSLGDWPGGAKRYFRFTITLPAGTGNTFQNKSTQVTYTWSATAGT
jgi:hypothetical protein